MTWFRKAADQGDASALINLSVMHKNGEGVPQDDVEALKWILLAEAEGSSSAPGRRELIAKRMTPEQIAEAEKRAREWKPTLVAPE